MLNLPNFENQTNPIQTSAVDFSDPPAFELLEIVECCLHRQATLQHGGSTVGRCENFQLSM